jgi:hypothetical protein
MTPLDALIHLLNFAAPALTLALTLPLLARLLGRFSGINRAASLGWMAQAAINFIAGLAVLATGLWFFGRDGKMATYAALVLVLASMQWGMGGFKGRGRGG